MPHGRNATVVLRNVVKVPISEKQQTPLTNLRPTVAGWDILGMVDKAGWRNEAE